MNKKNQDLKTIKRKAVLIPKKLLSPYALANILSV